MILDSKHSNWRSCRETTCNYDVGCNGSSNGCYFDRFIGKIMKRNSCLSTSSSVSEKVRSIDVHVLTKSKEARAEAVSGHRVGVYAARCRNCRDCTQSSSPISHRL